MIRRGIIWFLLALSIPGYSQNGGKMSREQYIESYAELAMKEMGKTGIPASITLAQGCLESDNGNSRLAVQGNNHFGIKCHDWEGKRIYHDDDERNECFRKYKNAYDSYIDHSYFLSSKQRYAGLFELKTDDYKGWAKGLKKAGYATSPKYADLLIGIIEENELYRYDQLVLAGDFREGMKPEETMGTSGSGTGREIYVRNKIEYILVEEGDTPESLRRELELYKNELYRYNDLEKDAALYRGQLLYLQPKRKKAEIGNNIHIIQEGETMYDISQQYGVKMEHLYRRNNITEGEHLFEGTEIYLRKKKRDPVLKIEPVEEEPEQEMEFRFEGGGAS